MTTFTAHSYVIWKSYMIGFIYSTNFLFTKVLISLICRKPVSLQGQIALMCGYNDYLGAKML